MKTRKNMEVRQELYDSTLNPLLQNQENRQENNYSESISIHQSEVNFRSKISSILYFSHKDRG